MSAVTSGPKTILTLTHDYLPQSINGLIISTDTEAAALTATGRYTSHILTTLKLDRRSLTYWRVRFTEAVFNRPYRDSLNGYSVYRSTSGEDCFETLARSLKPDAVIVHPTAFRGSAEQLKQSLNELSCPVIINFLALQSFWTKPGLFTPDFFVGKHVLTNSEFMSRELKKRLQLTYLPEYIYPSVDADEVIVETTRRKVVFVNPVREKGLAIALGLAESRPDIPFEFIGAWGRGQFDDATLLEKAENLSNVDMRPAETDKSKIYQDARIVLAPSLNEDGAFIEAWGRIATEAHFSGIPVLASAGHGFDESVGPGGMLVDVNAPIEDWTEALSQMWDNPDVYSSLSEAALEYSKRPSIACSACIQKMDAFLQSVMQSQ